MSKEDKQSGQLDNKTAGGHLGGTRFGQQPGDAKEKPASQEGRRGDKARPNDGKN